LGACSPVSLFRVEIQRRRVIVSGILSGDFMQVSCLECFVLIPEEHGTPVWDTESKPIVLEGYLCNDCVAHYLQDGPYERPEKERLN